MTGGAYTEEECERGQRVMIAEGVFARAMEGVTSGVILAGFALALGATDFEIGLLAAIPFLAQLAHIPAIALLSRFPDRRRLAVAGAVGARSLFFIVAVSPFLALPLRPVTALVAVLVCYATLAALSGASWQVWVRQLVPRERLGAYFGHRMAILSAIGLVTLLASGQFVSYWSSRHPDRVVEAFAALFAIGGLLGLVSAAILHRAPSRPAKLQAPEPLGKIMREPFQDANYRRVLVFLGAWGFAANISLPFVSVVLLRTLGYSVAVVTLLAALSQVANIAGLRLWAPLTDRFGNKPVLGLSASVFLVGVAVWILMPKVPGTGALVTAGFVHVLFGFSVAGLDVASNGIVMKMAKEDLAPAYLSSASIVKSVATGVAPLLGGVLATVLASRVFTVRLSWSHPGGEAVVTALRFAGHDFLFLASLVLGLYAIHRLLGFKEEGEAPPERVVRAMRREVGQVSSVAGMRAFAHVASYLIEASYRFERSLDVRRALETEEEEARRFGSGPTPPRP